VGLNSVEHGAAEDCMTARITSKQAAGTKRRGRVPTHAPTARSETPRPGLSVDLIVDTACQLISESHADDLTMRRLSERLGVALGATYHYVPDRDSLLVLVAQRINAQVSLRSTRPDRWASTMRSLMFDYAEAYARYPGMARFSNAHLAATRPDATQRAVLTLLTGAGFKQQSARTVLAAFFFYTSGLTMSDLTNQDQPGYPAADIERGFREGLELIIEGAKAQLRVDKRARR
jgi:AcrR family transcriptional regulator